MLLVWWLIVGRVRPSSQLYEQILAENEKLKAQLRDTDLELADLKLQLEKATQVHMSAHCFRWSPLMIPDKSTHFCFFLFAEAGTLCRPITAWDGEKGNDGTRLLTDFLINLTDSEKKKMFNLCL